MYFLETKPFGERPQSQLTNVFGKAVKPAVGFSGLFREVEDVKTPFP